jgi:hypothetical protein
MDNFTLPLIFFLGDPSLTCIMFCMLGINIIVYVTLSKTDKTPVSKSRLKQFLIAMLVLQVVGLSVCIAMDNKLMG